MRNNTAEDVSNSPEGSLDATDAVADLLTGGMEEALKEDEESAEDKNAETKESTAESTEEAGESEEAGEEEETTLEAVAEGDDDTWSSVLGIDEDKLSFDDDGNLNGVITKVNGEASTIKLDELLVGYQNNKSNTQKSQALSEEKKVFDQQVGLAVQEYKSKLANVTQLSDYLEKQLVSEFDGVNWEELRVANPAEYAAMRADFSTRAQELQRIKETTQATADEQSQTEQRQTLEQNNVRMARQYGKMIDNNPTWSDAKVYEKDMGALKEFCADKYGFDDQDFKLVQDSRLIELIKDAGKYHAGVKVANKKIKKVVPKFQKSVGKSPKSLSKLDKLTNKAKNSTGHAKRDAQRDAVAELLTGGM